MPLSVKNKPPELRMTPIIDVIFMLLIFFVCTANFRSLEGVLPTDMSLPGTSAAQFVLPVPEKLDSARITLTFDRSPHWTVESNQCRTLAEVRTLLRQLREAKKDLPVIIASEQNVPMEYVIDLYDACRAAGLSKIQFAATAVK
ncbi:MAG: biopolymer transporter ExbD [Planctomycetaceae bacterium]|jgi:biopolymer transport protein ExbD|nr:biopolymer transporter ExbD [Planctomycetaceae bacterium]